MPKLTDQEMMDFLAERSHLARIATVRADGSPSVVPVWFIFEGGKVLITPRKHSAFLQNLRREPRVAITIDEEAGRYRKVLFEGTAEILFEPGTTASGTTSTDGSHAATSTRRRPTTT